MKRFEREGRERRERERESWNFFSCVREMSKESRRGLRIRSLRFWKMIQRREEGRSFRNVRVELKDGYVFEK